MDASTEVPPELVYDILIIVLRDYFHEYVVEKDTTSWDAVTTLFQVSRLFQDITRKLVSQTFEIGISEASGRLQSSPRGILIKLHELFMSAMPDTDTSEAAPFISVYQVYLVSRAVRLRVLPEERVSLITPDGRMPPLVISKRNRIVPFSMGERVWNAQLEEHWILSIASVLACAARDLEQLDGNPGLCNDAAQCQSSGHAAIARVAKESIVNIVKSESGRLPPFDSSDHSISSLRACELLPELFTRFRIITWLQQVADSPCTNCRNTAVLIEMALLLLRRWNLQGIPATSVSSHV